MMALPPVEAERFGTDIRTARLEGLRAALPPE